MRLKSKLSFAKVYIANSSFYIQERNEDNMKKNRIILICVIIAIMCISVGVFALMRTVINGHITATVATPIVNIEVQDKNDDSKINSYYDVIVKNYDANGKVSEVACNYSVTLETTDGTSVPEYCWYDANGNSLGTTLSGSFATSKSDTSYKITFKNDGSEEVTKKIKFNVVATQQK